MSFSHKTRVGVLRGGPSSEYDVSLDTGKTILANLPEEYEPLDIFISKDGAWHSRGLEKKPYEILKSVDLVINALHGSYGEDGTVQKLLEDLGVPYTGSNSLSSALGMNKTMSKEIFRQSGIKTPYHIVIQKSNESDSSARDMEIRNQTINKINENLIFPVIIKPANLGSSIGVSYVGNTRDIKNALIESFRHSPKLIVEEFIDGKEATCGVIEDWRGRDFYTLLPVEVERNKEKYFHDYHSKYVLPGNGLGSKYKVPGNFTYDEKAQIEEAAALIHKALGLRHYSRSDFILHPRRGLFVLEVNTLPELTHRSSFIKSLEAAGSNIKEFLSHLVLKALRRK